MSGLGHAAGRLRALVASVLLVAGMLSSGAIPVSAASITITLHCYSHPETTRVTNNTGHSITVNTVGSTYKPYSGEPYGVYNKLGAHSSITYRSGYTASGSHVLTHQYIYNDNESDGVRVKTSAGTYTKHC